MGCNNIYILFPFNFLIVQLNNFKVKIPMYKNYWNYCDREKTIADTIDIATFLSMQ